MVDEELILRSSQQKIMLVFPNKYSWFFPILRVKTALAGAKNFCFYKKGLIIAVE